MAGESIWKRGMTVGFGLLAIAAEFLLGALAWWSVAVGNLLAATTMGFDLWKGDPDLQQAVRSLPFE